MMYPLITLEDCTEFVHSEMKADGTVRVYVEKPDAADGFHSASCWLPAYRWEDVSGFTQEEISGYQSVIESLSHLILRFAKEGGLENAAGF